MNINGTEMLFFDAVFAPEQANSMSLDKLVRTAIQETYQENKLEFEERGLLGVEVTEIKLDDKTGDTVIHLAFHDGAEPSYYVERGE